jgi:hypothetical protein
MMFGRLATGCAVHGLPSVGHTPLPGHATPPAHMPSIVAQHGFRPATCWLE